MVSVNSVLELFREEVADVGGCVQGHVTDGRRLYARSLLPEGAHVLPGDLVKPGVAVRQTEEEIEVRPYVFREICRNGAIAAYSARGRRMDIREPRDPASLLFEVRQAVRAAASREGFAELVEAMRASRGRHVDMELMTLWVLRRGDLRSAELLDLMGRFERSGRRDLFAFGNALTSLARDTADPELRWRREALGAAVFARRSPAPASRPRHAARPLPC